MLDLIEDSIAYAINGFPASNLTFFLITPLEPPRAAIKQIGFAKIIYLDTIISLFNRF